MSKIPGGISDDDEDVSAVPEGATGHEGLKGTEEKLGDRLRAMAKLAVIRKESVELERRKAVMRAVYSRATALMVRAAQVEGEFKHTVHFSQNSIGMDWFNTRRPPPLQVWFSELVKNDGLQLKWEGYKNQRDGDLVINSFTLSWA